MHRVVLLACASSLLGGCASLSYPLPKCDGYSKRPLNRSMWEWERADRPVFDRHSGLQSIEPNRTLAFAGNTTTAIPFGKFDEAASFRACTIG